MSNSPSESSLEEAAAKPQTPGTTFEVEIHVGNRAADAQRLKTAGPAPDSSLSPLALRRRERARQRRSLLTIALASLALALAIWGTAAWWQPLIEANVVARVNGQPITIDEVQREIKLSKAISSAATGKEQAPAPPSMLEQLIITKMKVQAAQRTGLSVTPGDVDAEISDLLRQANLTPEKLDQSLRSYGLTREDLRASFSDVALIDRFVERYVISGASDTKVRLAKIDKWQNDLVQLAKVERLRNPTTSAAPRVGSEAPDFVLKDLNGKEIRLGALRGKTVMINFWAPWCPPCRAEIPMLRDAYVTSKSGGNGKEGFEILGVAIQSEVSNVNSFVQEFNVSFPVLMDSQNQVTDLYQVGPIPTSYFVDKNGTIRAVQIGQLDASTLNRLLETAR